MDREPAPTGSRPRKETAMHYYVIAVLYACMALVYFLVALRG